MDFLIATRNQGKIAEFRQMLGSAVGGRLRVRGLDEIQTLLDPEETGRTFRANACLKASAYAREVRCWSLADDSGLAVDALGGAPGVYSARFAELHGAGRGDDDNNRHLLRLMEHVADEQRTARFVCVLALADPRGNILYTTAGEIEGRLLREGRGDNGFGYDPLFLVPSLGRTTAQLPPEQKHAISHRGSALRRMRLLLVRWGLPG